MQTIEERLEIYGPATCPVCGEYARTFIRNRVLDELVCLECNDRENAAVAYGT